MHAQQQQRRWPRWCSPNLFPLQQGEVVFFRGGPRTPFPGPPSPRHAQAHGGVEVIRAAGMHVLEWKEETSHSPMRCREVFRASRSSPCSCKIHLVLVIFAVRLSDGWSLQSNLLVGF